MTCVPGLAKTTARNLLRRVARTQRFAGEAESSAGLTRHDLNLAEGRPACPRAISGGSLTPLFDLAAGRTGWVGNGS